MSEQEAREIALAFAMLGASEEWCLNLIEQARNGELKYRGDK